MKVLFLTNIPAPYRVEFFDELGKYCDLTVLYELKAASDRDASWRAGGKGHFRAVYLSTLQTISDGGISLQVLSYLKRSYDVIVVGTHGTPTAKLAMLYMRARRIPFLLNIDGMLSADVAAKGQLNRLLRTALFSLASAFLLSGKETERYLAALSSSLGKRPTYFYRFSSIHDSDVLPAPVTREEKEQIKSKLGIREKFVVLSVGRFIPGKGIDGLIAAFSSMQRNEVALSLIGGRGEIYEGQLANVAGSIRERIHFPGFLTKKQLMEWYRCADVFVLPTHHDVWGLVVNEAMACGLPIITTDACGAGIEMIQDGENGYLYPHNDISALNRCLEQILSDSDLQQTMARNNLARIKQYTIETMAADHIRIFQQSVQESEA